MKKYIPIKSLRTFQRYMGRAEFEITAHENMRHPTSPSTYQDTSGGGWIPCNVVDARKWTIQNYLAVRAVIEVPELAEVQQA